MGGTDITMAQLASTAAVFSSIASLQQSTCGQTDGPTDTQAAACNRFSSGALIQFRMAETYAAANDITVDDADVQKTLDSFQKNVGADVLSTQLTASSATLDDVRELVRLSLVQEAVAKAVTADALGEAGAAEALPAADRRLHDAARGPHPGRFRGAGAGDL